MTKIYGTIAWHNATDVTINATIYIKKWICTHPPQNQKKKEKKNNAQKKRKQKKVVVNPTFQKSKTMVSPNPKPSKSNFIYIYFSPQP